MERIYCKSMVRVQCLVDSEASSRDEKKMSMGSQKTVKITIDCMATSLLFLSLLQINLIFYLLELKIQIKNDHALSVLKKKRSLMNIN